MEEMQIFTSSEPLAEKIVTVFNTGNQGKQERSVLCSLCGTTEKISVFDCLIEITSLKSSSIQFLFIDKPDDYLLHLNPVRSDK